MYGEAVHYAALPGCLYPMPKVLSASHMPRIFMGGSQTGGTGVSPVSVEEEKQKLLLATAMVKASGPSTSKNKT